VEVAESPVFSDFERQYQHRLPLIADRNGQPASMTPLGVIQQPAVGEAALKRQTRQSYDRFLPARGFPDGGCFGDERCVRSVGTIR
jgi:hypothetical protein